LEQGKEAKLMAGGTDLLVTMKNGGISPRQVIDLKRIAAIPVEILPAFIDVIKNGVERKSSMYEIGAGKLTRLEMGIQEIGLSVNQPVKRMLVFWRQGRDDYAREEVVLVPSGPNGSLKLLVEPV
jgi:hypothetical protein